MSLPTPTTSTDDALREHLAWLIEKGHAHASFEESVADMPESKRGTVPERFEHSPWQLLEHLRICQWDILEFSRLENHISPSFPDGLWPQSPEPPDALAWDNAIEEFLADRAEMVDLIRDPATDLYANIPWGDGQTILREALLLADHNAYHVGQMVAVRKVLGCWPGA